MTTNLIRNKYILIVYIIENIEINLQKVTRKEKTVNDLITLVIYSLFYSGSKRTA